MSIKFISSRENPLYKELKQLAASAQARRKAGRTLLDGIHLCDAYLRHAGMPLLCLTSESARAISEVASIVSRCEAGKAECIVFPDRMFGALAQVEHGIDLVFVVGIPRLTQAPGLDQSAVLLDNLQDPGNLGSILRSAAAAGIGEIYCGNGTAAAWSPKVLRAGMGAHFLLRIFENVELLELVKASTVPVIATSSHAKLRLYDLDLKAPAAWLFGHEGQGVSPDLLACSTRQIAIPHLGPVESLNVAASAAVCLFEQVRQKTIR
jgi:TrmH family RNA methyltransferase